MVPRGAIVAIGTCEKGRSNAESCGEHGGTKKVIRPACHDKIIVLLLLLFLGQTMQVAPLPTCPKLSNMHRAQEQESNGNEV